MNQQKILARNSQKGIKVRKQGSKGLSKTILHNLWHNNSI